MKSLRELSLNIPEQDYHNLPAWSYSIIAKYARDGFSAISTLHDKVSPTPAMEFGSLFDSILTKGKQTLEEYAIYDGEVPQAEKRALDLMTLYADTPDFDKVSDEVIAMVCEGVQYYPKWGLEAKKKHLAEYKDYYSVAFSKKKIVSKKDWDDAVQMARIFRNDPYLSKIFGTKNTPEIEYLYQCQFQVKYVLPNGQAVDVKIMPDLLVVNHKEKTIQPVDLKTSGMPAYEFPDHWVKMRYDLQASCYVDVLVEVLGQTEEYSDYTILPYLFTDISRTDMVPLTFEYDPTSITQANGLSFGNEYKTYTYKNWQSLLQEILSYEESNATVPIGMTTEGPNDLLSLLKK